MSTPSTAAGPILVWDLPVRISHWLMALCFAGAYLSAESDAWRLLHITLGYTLGALVLFRLIWGVAGSRYARFTSFVRGPAAVLAYFRSLAAGKPQHFLGHNPAGALAILAMLGLALAVTGSGWALLHAAEGGVLEELHEALANLMLGVVLLHIAAVIISSRLHRENLVAAMLHGKKEGWPQQAARRSWALLGAVLLLAVLGFWGLQAYAPVVTVPADSAAQAPTPAEEDH